MPEYIVTGPTGTELSVRVWEPDTAPRALVLISHGYGEHSGRYQHVAERLRAADYLVVAHDHAGHGRSGGKPGQIRFDRAVADLDAVLSSQVRQHPKLERVLLGHSFGAAVALRYAIAHQHRLLALILSGPLLSAKANPVLKLLAPALAKLAPGAPAARIDPATVSRDPAVVEAYMADPLVRHAPVPLRTGVEFMRHAETIFTDADEITLPTLLMWGEADKLCPPSYPPVLADAMGSADLTQRPFRGLYHEIFNEPEQEQVLDEMLDWLEVRVRVGAYWR
ncbi:MAG: lysophospholipase [Solirubrobacterales bacterium]|nr:lysophospholipase [Solirubrobacterales bacterium]